MRCMVRISLKFSCSSRDTADVSVQQFVQQVESSSQRSLGVYRLSSNLSDSFCCDLLFPYLWTERHRDVLGQRKPSADIAKSHQAMKLGQAIANDVKARLPWYVSDWKEGFQSGFRCA